LRQPELVDAKQHQLWNEMYWWDNGIQTHDLCEEPTDLCITGTDACSGSNVNIEYLLFLDLDGDGMMETVVNSVNTGIAGLGWNNVLYGNLNTPNFSGGTPRQFDERNVPNNQKWGFSIQETVLATTRRPAYAGTPRHSRTPTWYLSCHTARTRSSGSSRTVAATTLSTSTPSR
jgi:hypothetical protein